MVECGLVEDEYVRQTGANKIIDHSEDPVNSGQLPAMHLDKTKSTTHHVMRNKLMYCLKMLSRGHLLMYA